MPRKRKTPSQVKAHWDDVELASLIEHTRYLRDARDRPTERHLEEIARAIGVTTGAVKLELSALVAAERWLRLRNRPDRWVPSKVAEELRLIEGQCNRLLSKFGIANPRDAADGPQHETIARAFALVSGEDDMRAALEGIARLSAWARKAQAHLLDPTADSDINTAVREAVRGVEPGHSGDPAITDWIRDLAPIYQNLTGRIPTASWDRKAERATHFTAFVAACAEPLGLRRSEAGWKNLIGRIGSFKKSE
jgi:hypothetical protein